ncbi:MAG: hypothetical protein H3C27_06330 [Opitutaceae bacterium]|nr:hypothetical protein [Opitutaceae bacterium]
MSVPQREPAGCACPRRTDRIDAIITGPAQKDYWIGIRSLLAASQVAKVCNCGLSCREQAGARARPFCIPPGFSGLITRCRSNGGSGISIRKKLPLPPNFGRQPRALQTADGADHDELHDLAADPDETHNLAHDSAHQISVTEACARLPFPKTANTALHANRECHVLRDTRLVSVGRPAGGLLCVWGITGGWYPV